MASSSSLTTVVLETRRLSVQRETQSPCASMSFRRCLLMLLRSSGIVCTFDVRQTFVFYVCGKSH